VEAYQEGVAMCPPGKPSDEYPLYSHMRTVTVNGVEYIDLLYMVLYPFNFGPKILNVGRRYGDHVADLEHVRILVQPDTMLIECVYFGAHSGGTWKHRDECMIDGETLNVYVACGTHANYGLHGTKWRVPPVLKDVASRDGYAWMPDPSMLLPVPDMSTRIADKVMDFKNQRWWDSVPPMTPTRKWCL
jgi:hypothetical protein